MEAMYVLTVKRDGGTQNVLDFYQPHQLADAIGRIEEFMDETKDSPRSICRLEWYNPNAQILSPSEEP